MRGYTPYLSFLILQWFLRNSNWWVAYSLHWNFPGSFLFRNIYTFVLQSPFMLLCFDCAKGFSEEFMCLDSHRDSFIIFLIPNWLLRTLTVENQQLAFLPRVCIVYLMPVWYRGPICKWEIGLEVWTMRTPEFGSDKDYPPPCLIGLNPFISLRRITFVGDSIVLLSKYAMNYNE